ncbi:YfiR family protein [Aquabacterium sp. J223]|uniref:YfiR family protein n=1 Tax=Aquabacterium sp. J223 TaxID=2898431 RepID=UPI0021ADEEF0|nr:YfiR family protein [Aquabacterium sp. J223]UUX94440.1 YfiR family protein [Aquabacterium sp. J223]
MPAPPVSPADLKAAYLVRFSGFVEWPTPTPPVLVLAVAGAPEVAAALQHHAAGRQAGGPELATRAVRTGDPVDDVHLLFVGGPRSYAESWAMRLQGRPVLLVTDVPEGLPEGSAINFVHVGERLRFEVSLRALERARLRASARLLGVAVKVVE